jgi:hypothetical protein
MRAWAERREDGADPDDGEEGGCRWRREIRPHEGLPGVGGGWGPFFTAHARLGGGVISSGGGADGQTREGGRITAVRVLYLPLFFSQFLLFRSREDI